MGSIRLKGRTKEGAADTAVGSSLLQTAQELGVDWEYRCTRGTCARCRCKVEQGGEFLNDITDAEWNRMDEEEFEQGYRLGCQAVVVNDGDILAVNRPY